MIKDIHLTEKEYKRLKCCFENVIEIYRVPLTITGREDFERAVLSTVVEITKKRLGGFIE